VISGLSGLAQVLSLHKMSGLSIRYCQAVFWKPKRVTLLTTTGLSTVEIKSSVFLYMLDRWSKLTSVAGNSHYLCHVNVFTLVFLTLGC